MTSDLWRHLPIPMLPANEDRACASQKAKRETQTALGVIDEGQPRAEREALAMMLPANEECKCALFWN